MEPKKLYRKIGDHNWNLGIDIIKRNPLINDLIVSVKYSVNNYAWIYALITKNNSLRKIILKISIDKLKQFNNSEKDLIDYIKQKIY